MTTLGHQARLLAFLFLFGCLAIGILQGQGYRNFNLTCLAPLLEQVDSEAPATLEVAFLRGPTRAPGLREGVGTIDFPISKISPEAQEFFNQGVALLFGLDSSAAERSFREALISEPDHPMVFWGLAMANEQRPGRARLFANRAVKRINNETSEQEKLWIQSVARFFGVRPDGSDKLPPPPTLSAEGSFERVRRRIQDLEEIVLLWPNDINAKAFLLRQLTLDKYRSGTPITSHVAVNTLAQTIAEADPNHPSRHYQIFLWMGERPEVALTAAEVTPTLAPGIPNSWRYSAEAWKANGLNNNAIPLLKTSLRISHSQLQESFSMPSKLEGLSSNYTSLVETLASMGRIDEAVQWARRMILMPRSLAPGSEFQPTLYAQGKKLWVEARLGAGMAEVLLEELESEPLLQPAGTDSLENSRWLYWNAAALCLLDRPKEALEKQRRIEAWSNRVESAAASDLISKLLNGLDVWQELLGGDLVKSGEPPPFIPSWIWARELEKHGMSGEGLKLVSEVMEELPGQWLPTATFCELSFAAGEVVPAMAAFDRQFRTDAFSVDSSLPHIERLDALAQHMQLPPRWSNIPRANSKPNIPANPDSLGPLHWEIPEAPDFSLSDCNGTEYSLASFQDDAILLQFVLGVTCPFCTRQLDEFRKYEGAYEAAGIKTVIITTDSVESLAKLFSSSTLDTQRLKAKFPYPVLADPDQDLFRSYRVYDDFEDGGMHGTFLISPNGRLLWSHVSHSTFEKPRLLLDEAKRLLKAN